MEKAIFYKSNGDVLCECELENDSSMTLQRKEDFDYFLNQKVISGKITSSVAQNYKTQTMYFFQELHEQEGLEIIGRINTDEYFLYRINNIQILEKIYSTMRSKSPLFDEIYHAINRKRGSGCPSACIGNYLEFLNQKDTLLSNEKNELLKLYHDFRQTLYPLTTREISFNSLEIANIADQYPNSKQFYKNDIDYFYILQNGQGITFVTPNDTGRTNKESLPFSLFEEFYSTGKVSYYETYAIPTFQKILSIQSASRKQTIFEKITPQTPPLNQILYGPPGTGKTYNTINKTLEILGEETESKSRQELKELFEAYKAKGQIEFVTFHQNYGYEEFVEGIKPKFDSDKNNDLEYEVKSGIFKKICDKARENLEDSQITPHILIIDEINRGNVSKIFGELITLIEPSKRIGADEALQVTLPYSQEFFGVPNNLYIIGTMNTADRSITSLDTALRRRFEFVEMMPDHTKLSGKTINGIELDKLLQAINERIEFLYDREKTIGHAYLLGIDSLAKLKEVFQNKIIPLLQEYFYNDYEAIQAVLNHNGMIQIKTHTTEDYFKTFINDRGLDEKKIFEITPKNNKNIWDIPSIYIAIYDEQVAKKLRDKTDIPKTQDDGE
ncbi:McrB family protein [Helicobacter pametensis]|uniref:McrB family protein n=1 Tax=Helicobacter pametensis TaxID=95149 RepID=UPI0004B1D268|nr:AAA family ATPase [Helicobacter pametensis]